MSINFSGSLKRKFDKRSEVKMLILSILQRNADNQFISQIANAKEHLGDKPLTDEIAKQVGEPKYADELAKLDKATDTTPPAEEKSFGDKVREVAGEVAESVIKGVLGISEAHAGTMDLSYLHEDKQQNQHDSGMVKTGYQSENNHRHSEPNENTHNQAEKDRSGSVKGEKTQAEKQNIAIDDKLNPKTSAWAFKDPEKLNEFQDKGLVDKPIVGQDDKEEKKYNLPVDKWLAEHKDWQEKHTDWRLGVTSKQYESGGKGPGTISSGSGDAGGISYGTYQIKTQPNGGTMKSYLAWSEYGKEFDGLKINSPEFQAKWKEIAKKEPKAFEDDQHRFIGQTHCDEQFDYLKKKGFDLSSRGPAIYDAVWSTSVQYGGGTSVIAEALKGCNISKMTDRELIEKIYQYKHDTVGKNNVGELVKNKKTGKLEHHAWFNTQGKTPEEQRKYEQMRASVRNRFINEKRDLLKLCD